ncbi:MAG TPA: hypothetical protein VN651_16245 [Gemmatimonadaceae bacterium]|nr:hypothetical protein [Gemmatimonadaceae bacterium]
MSAPQTAETVGDWIAAARPLAPVRLADRLAEQLGAGRARSAADTPEACVDAAVSLLHELLARESAGRESALDLLTVDALVTYAFEAASADVDRLRPRALDAMSRLATTAATST